MGRKILSEYQRQENHSKRVRIKHRRMRAKTRRADINHERRNSRNENGTSRITKGSDRQRPLPNKLGAINKEKRILYELSQKISEQRNWNKRRNDKLIIKNDEIYRKKSRQNKKTKQNVKKSKFVLTKMQINVIITMHQS